MRSLLITTAAAMLIMVADAGAQTRIEQNNKHQTIGLSGLYADTSCSPVDVSGKVVKTDFSDNALTITGFVVERKNGTRQFVNVSIPDGLGSASMSEVYEGLQRLLKPGHSIHGRALACGRQEESSHSNRLTRAG
jgi:hypothetical protein